MEYETRIQVTARRLKPETRKRLRAEAMNAIANDRGPYRVSASNVIGMLDDIEELETKLADAVNELATEGLNISDYLSTGERVGELG